MGKKKRSLIESHTLSHLRGISDHSHSHTRVRQIDTRVAGAGVLGSRIKAPRHHGPTVLRIPPHKSVKAPAPPRAPKPPSGSRMPVRGPSRKSLTIMGPQGPRGHQVEKGHEGGRGSSGRKGREGKTGKDGKHGKAGPAGSAGAVGGTGPKGDSGQKGVKGKKGEGGRKGDRGDKGYQGVQGMMGMAGGQGGIGPQGPQGHHGPMGLRGRVGGHGPQGIAGPQGIQGLRGPMGYQGFTGIPGRIGPMGSSQLVPRGPNVRAAVERIQVFFFLTAMLDPTILLRWATELTRAQTVDPTQTLPAQKKVNRIDAGKKDKRKGSTHTQNHGKKT